MAITISWHIRCPICNYTFLPKGTYFSNYPNYRQWRYNGSKCPNCEEIKRQEIFRKNQILGNARRKLTLKRQKQIKRGNEQTFDTRLFATEKDITFLKEIYSGKWKEKFDRLEQNYKRWGRFTF